MSDPFDPESYETKRFGQIDQNGQGGGVAIIVVGIMVLALFVFAAFGDSGPVPADLAETATNN
ncbi:MAG: hypothetical protein AAGA70_00065 [Pseudomonadota bacterium]